MRAIRIDEIRRGGDSLGSLGVGDSGLCRAWDELSTTNHNPASADNPINWNTLAQEQENFPDRFPEWVLKEISQAMNADPHELAVKNFARTLSSTDSIIEGLLATAIDLKKIMPNQPTGITAGISMSVRDEYGVGMATLAAMGWESEVPTCTYYVVRIPKKIKRKR